MLCRQRRGARQSRPTRPSSPCPTSQASRGFRQNRAASGATTRGRAVRHRVGPEIKLHQCGLPKRWRSSWSSHNLPQDRGARAGHHHQERQEDWRRKPRSGTSSKRVIKSTDLPTAPHLKPAGHPGVEHGDRGQGIQLTRGRHRLQRRFEVPDGRHVPPS